MDKNSNKVSAHRLAESVKYVFITDKCLITECGRGASAVAIEKRAHRPRADSGETDISSGCVP